MTDDDRWNGRQTEVMPKKKEDIKKLLRKTSTVLTISCKIHVFIPFFKSFCTVFNIPTCGTSETLYFQTIQNFPETFPKYFRNLFKNFLLVLQDFSQLFSSFFTLSFFKIFKNISDLLFQIFSFWSIIW